ncbi:hypothetical protein ACFOLD_16270 [Kocuria carniphila]|uniref:hypothetical protein n=1 Tax=Kocuria carniphila TaxID=262208 RepID=UPI0036199489
MGCTYLSVVLAVRGICGQVFHRVPYPRGDLREQPRSLWNSEKRSARLANTDKYPRDKKRTCSCSRLASCQDVRMVFVLASGEMSA